MKYLRQLFASSVFFAFSLLIICCEQSAATESFYITYNGNENSGGSAPIDGTAYVSGSTATILRAGTLYKDGYLFSGWNENKEGTGTAHAPDSLLTVVGNVVLYAQWTLVKSAEHYRISYIGNGNTGGIVPTDDTNYTSGATATVLGSGSLSRGSFVFTGWNTKADGTGTQYKTGAILTINESISLYAQWSGGSTITVSDPPSGISLSLTNADGTSLGDVVFIDTPKTILATTSRTPDYYAWYLDGSVIAGAQTNSITIGTGLIPREYYNLTCVIRKDSVLLSASYVFQVK